MAQKTRPKAKKVKKVKAPSDGTMDEHALVQEIKAAEKRLREAEASYDEARRECKEAAGVVTARMKTLRALTSDSADGQSRFSDPGPLRDWREIPIEELGLSRTLTQKICAWGVGLNNMGELADFAAGPLGQKAASDLTEKERGIFAERIEGFRKEHPEARESAAQATEAVA